MVTPDDFRDAVELLASGTVKAAPPVTQRGPIDQIDEAFEIQLDPESAVKVLVTSDTSSTAG